MRIRESYRKVFHFNQYGRDQWVAKRAAMVPPGASVLDIGAGGCRYAHLFTHCRYLAMDFAVASGAVRRLDVIADIARLPLSDQVFDVALCTEVIEHVPEPIVAIGEIARILRPGGELLLTAPLGSGLHQFPFHYYGGFTPHWYRVFLPKLGFTDIRVEPNGGFFKHYGQESQRFNNLVDPRQLKGIAGAPRMFMGLLWLASFPWCRVVAPLFCHFLDSADRSRDFTVGYFVTAVRRGL